MAKIFITGSADGLGLRAANTLMLAGHEVVLHARNEERARHVLTKISGAPKVLIADLSNIAAVKKLAEEANASGPFDAVIHNAGVYQVPAKLISTVNVLAPYLLTSLMKKPKRLIYLGSGMHLQGNANLKNFPDQISYSDSKLFVLALSMAVARTWKEVFSNTVNPGWVPTKMGGPGAPDDLEQGAETQTWLAVSNDEKAKVSGRYFYHKKEERSHPDAGNLIFQDELLAACERITGVRFL